MKHYDYEISLFVENELPEDKKEELLSHLSTCKKCSRMMRDYENIKNNIAQFYKTLPDFGNEIKFGATLPSKFSLKPGTRKYVMPISAAALVILLLLFLVKVNFQQPKVNLATTVKKELVLSDYYNISTFNRAINKAIESREQKTILGEHWQGDSYTQQLEFNKAINSALNSIYND